MDKITYIIAGFATVETILILITFWMFSNLVGAVNDLQTTVMPITGMLLAIIIIHTVLWYLYFQYEPMVMNLFFLITGSMAMIFSISAVSISLCQRT
jgi:hypothetical protein